MSLATTLEPLAYGVEDAARVMGISSGSVRRLVQKGDIPAVRWNSSKNGRIIIKRDDLERFLEGVTK
jgi:excisionase family DNA binding protein